MAGGKTSSPIKEDAPTPMTPSNEDAPTPITPHLARNDESPQDLQNRQGTTAAASTSAVSPSAIATAATATTAATDTTTATIDADLVVDESAEEDHGDGEVGNADPVHDESAEENTIVLSKSFDWIIEGVEELDEGNIRHMNAFYALLKKWMFKQPAGCL
jgi:hypothetical protein